MAYRRHTLQADSDQTFYSMVLKLESPDSDDTDSHASSNSDGIDSQAFRNSDAMDPQASSNTDYSQLMDDSEINEIIIVD